MTYLTKINRTYYLRLVVPPDLKDHYRTREIKRSLRTRCLADARKLLYPALADLQKQFHEIRGKRMYTPPTITAEAVTIFRRLHPGTQTHVSVTTTQSFGPGWVVEQEAGLAPHPDLVAIQVRLDEGWTLTASDEWEFVGVQTLQIPSAVLAPTQRQEPAPAPDLKPVASAPPPQKQLLLSEAIKLYKAHREAPADTVHYRPMDASTLNSDKQALKQLTRWLDGKDVPVESLLDLDYKKLTLFMMEEKNGKKGLNKASADTRLRYLRFFFNHLKEFGHIDRVPTIVSPKKHGEEKVKKANLPYSFSELNTFFSYVINNKPHKVSDRQSQLELTYLILMFIYTGFRSTEQASFTKNDIKTYNGVTYFDFTKLTKNNVASIRMVPVHSNLIELGLLEFAGKQKDKIFPVTIENYRKRFNEILYATGIKSTLRSKTFHSCRATFDTRLHGRIADSVRLTLMGHVKHGMDTIYLHQLLDNLTMYRDDLEKLVYELDFATLKADLLYELEYLYPADGTRARKGTKHGAV
ncbi:hypothetical protein KP004_01370 [Geomonas oryzisoli]|uniref:Tyr recombinase domain-containing protein n=1 Tax=Geomonas oryzisoli TaxID=2847992 RepID=A0ABX8J6D1_9BACT|nr:DUF6538 domain-containing protein [Geomonas oryzisoli]QWV93873.1 hypothetical protein KP004_01370 [Geomonas oryzisoli]